MNKNVVIVEKNENELKIIDVELEYFLTSYIGFHFISESINGDMRKLTEEEKFKIKEIFLGNLQVDAKDRSFKALPKEYFPIDEYLNNIYCQGEITCGNE